MYRLIYKSQIAVEIDRGVMRDILHESEDHNRQSEITGLLLATKTHFLQIIEGRYEDVNDTFMRIVRDSRHANIKLISFQVVDARLFDGWTMRGIGLFDFNKEIEKELKKKYGVENGDIKFPLEEWMVLAMINDIQMIQDLPSWKH